MTTSHSQTMRRGILMGAVVAGGLFAALSAPVQAMSIGPAPTVAGETAITNVQYGWGPRHHHHHGWGRGHHWGHGHHRGWGRHWGHHHHGGWGRPRHWGHRGHWGHHGHWH